MADKDQNQAKFSLRGAKPKSSELNKIYTYQQYGCQNILVENCYERVRK